MFKSFNADRLRNIFTAKYGQPASTVQTIVRNGYGREAANQIASWNFKEGKLTLLKYSSDLDTGYFMFENPAAEAREKAKNNAKDARAAETL